MPHDDRVGLHRGVLVTVGWFGIGRPDYGKHSFLFSSRVYDRAERGVY